MEMWIYLAVVRIEARSLDGWWFAMCDVMRRWAFGNSGGETVGSQMMQSNNTFWPFFSASRAILRIGLCITDPRLVPLRYLWTGYTSQRSTSQHTRSRTPNCALSSSRYSRNLLHGKYLGNVPEMRIRIRQLAHIHRSTHLRLPILLVPPLINISQRHTIRQRKYRRRNSHAHT